MMQNNDTGNHLKAVLSSKDPYAIASVFDLPTPGRMRSHHDEQSFRHTSLQVDDIDWTNVLTSLKKRNDSIGKNDLISGFTHQQELHASFNHLFSSSPGNIFVPTLHTIARSTFHCALLADKAASSRRHDSNTDGAERKDNARIQAAVTLLQESFSKTLNDRKEMSNVGSSILSEDGSKKVGVLYIVNLLFSMYFRLNTLRLCKNLLKPVESRKIHEKGAMGEMVTYRYYVGRLSMFEDHYEAAELHLDYALQHCHKNAIKNKRRILNYLLPVKLLRGRLPTEKLLQKYSLHEFRSVVQGIRSGDLRTFNDGLNKYQDLFIRRGTYLLLEKCKTVCYRNLFKRIYKIQDKTQIPLNYFVTSFKWLGLSIDLDEVECILANLIFRGFMKGYISHSKRTLVLSKRDPFPVSALCKV